VKFGVRAIIISALLGGCVAVPPREVPPHREVIDAADSARPTADRILSLLAAGEIDAAAALSNAPEQRAELLRAYRERVGETEFRRVFADYASHPAVREIAIGERRLLIWHLGSRMTAQYFVRSGNGFVLDDVPSAERDELRRLLAADRAGRVKPSAGTE
jgi:hypothetical protein